MNADYQEIAALGLVALAALGLLLRQAMTRRRPGCGGNCGCPPRKLPR